MKTSLILGSVLATSAIAHAEPPSLTATTTPAGPQNYLETGVGLSDDGALIGTLTLEGGHRLTRDLWLHGMLERGTAGGVDEPNYGGEYDAARIGIEARECVGGGVICAVAGVDAGVRHVDYMAEYDTTNQTGAVLVPRVGLDLGSRHLRFRPGLEKNVLVKDQDAGIALTGAVAYQW